MLKAVLRSIGDADLIPTLVDWTNLEQALPILSRMEESIKSMSGSKTPSLSAGFIHWQRVEEMLVEKLGDMDETKNLKEALRRKWNAVRWYTGYCILLTLVRVCS